MQPVADVQGLRKQRRPGASSLKATIGATVALLVALITAMIVFGLLLGGVR